MKTELIQNSLVKLLAMFRNQQFPAEIGWQIIRRRRGDRQLPSDSWSSGNRWIMLAQGTTIAMGFGQWHQFGRKVKPGSKAFYIFAPLSKKIHGDDETADPRTIITGFRLIPVFRQEDTVGKSLPTNMDLTPAALPPLFDVAAKLGVSAVRYVPFDGHALGIYNVGSKEIRLSEQSALTFYHELMHHLDSQIEPIRPSRLCEAELIAELGGSVLCSIQGIHGYESGSFRYLQMYAEGKEPEAVLKSLMAVASRVEQLVGIVLDAADEGQTRPALHSQEEVPVSA